MCLDLSRAWSKCNGIQKSCLETFKNQCMQDSFEETVVFKDYYSDKLVTYEDLVPTMKGAYLTMMRHLVFRLVYSRNNSFILENLAMFVCPVARRFREFIWHSNKIDKECLSSLFEMVSKNNDEVGIERAENPPKKLKIGAIEVRKSGTYPIKKHQSARSNFDQEVKQLDIHSLGNNFESQELSDILSDSSLTFQDLVKIFELYDPLEYWSKNHHKQNFPSLYEGNLVSLAYLASNSFQETVFSLAGDTIDDKRYTLLNSPSLFEATCV